MILKEMDQQKAFDYIIYMMVGSYFKTAKAASSSVESSRRLLYMLLGSTAQIRLEEQCEIYFLKEVLPRLPKGFLDTDVRVYFDSTGNGRYTSVVFEGNGRFLRIASQYGGIRRKPRFWCWAGVRAPARG